MVDYSMHLMPTRTATTERALKISGWLTGIYFVIELGIGLYTGSVAVTSDAFRSAKHVNDSPMRLHAGYDRLPMTLCLGSNLAAWPPLVAPQIKQLVDLHNWKIKGSGPLNEAQLVHIAFVKDPVVVGVPARGAQKPLALVIADQSCRDAGKSSRFANAHRPLPKGG